MPAPLSEYQFYYTSKPDKRFNINEPHNIEAYHIPSGTVVGALSWHDGGAIQNVEVLPEHRGNKLSDSMLEHAWLKSMSSKGAIPPPNHAEADDILTKSGSKFAKRTWWAGQEDISGGPLGTDISYDIETRHHK